MREAAIARTENTAERDFLQRSRQVLNQAMPVSAAARTSDAG
jgi:hypothetical protein